MNFDHTYMDAPLYAEDAVVKHFYDAALPSRYGSNFMMFKHMPSLDVFKHYEQQQKTFHTQHNMTHLRFLFPENETFATDVLQYITKQHYDVGSLELYAMLPIEFHGRLNEDVVVQYVDDTLFDAYLAFQYTIDLEYGEAFASEKQRLFKRQFYEPHVIFVAALLDGVIVGTLTLFETPDTIELDSFVVTHAMQRLGIGSTMQHFVMANHTTQTILLVADGEDTPREMYQKQGYHYCAARHEILMVRS